MLILVAFEFAGEGWRSKATCRCY